MESGEYKNRHRSSVRLLFLENVLYLIWSKQLSSGTIRILGKGLNLSGSITIFINVIKTAQTLIDFTRYDTTCSALSIAVY